MIKIRVMEAADAETVSELEQQIFSQPWSKQSFLDSLKNGYSTFFIGEAESKIVGYAGLHNMGGDGEITNVATIPEQRKNGVGYCLMQYLLNYGREHQMEAFTLEVRAGNEAAIHLYEKCGFIIEGTRKNFYEKPMEDALIMWKR